MHKPESVQENEKYKLLWDFEMQTNHKRKIKGEKLYKTPDLARERKKPWNMKLVEIQIVVRPLEQFSKTRKRRVNWRSEKESRQSKPQHR